MLTFIAGSSPFSLSLSKCGFAASRQEKPPKKRLPAML